MTPRRIQFKRTKGWKMLTNVFRIHRKKTNELKMLPISVYNRNMAVWGCPFQLTKKSTGEWVVERGRFEATIFKANGEKETFKS